MRSLVSAVVLAALSGCGGDDSGAGSGDPTMYGNSYDAYADGDGAVCGEGPNGGTVYCMPGDHCMSQDSATCQTVISGAYDAYSDPDGADGPVCGEGPNGGTVYCKPGDTCRGQDLASCTHSDDEYDAYGDADGAVCGEGPNGGTVYCEPGDTCLDQADARCQAN